MLTHIRVGFEQVFQLLQCALDVVTEIDMDMSYRFFSPFIHTYHGVEQLIDSLSGFCRRGHYGDTYHLAECLEVKIVAVTLKLVVHVQSYHHASVHIYQFGGQIQVTFEI